ncbi:MAG: nitroreductase [Pararhodobacter sp.]|nr:nitroreductase [Pararhodobacter sp.]
MNKATTDTAPPARQETLDFLLTRRSRPARLLRAPAPERATLMRLLTAAARVPDHGKLEPWRFIVLEGDALARLAALAETRGAEAGIEPERNAKTIAGFRASPLVVAVIAIEKPSPVIPPYEQLLSAGAVCLSLVNAALAAGYGACWLTGWPAFDRPFHESGLGLASNERVAGFIHLGSCDATPPERPRPDIEAITSWL